MTRLISNYRTLLLLKKEIKLKHSFNSISFINNKISFNNETFIVRIKHNSPHNRLRKMEKLTSFIFNS